MVGREHTGNQADQLSKLAAAAEDVAELAGRASGGSAAARDLGALGTRGLLVLGAAGTIAGSQDGSGDGHAGEESDDGRVLHFDFCWLVVLVSTEVKM